jgi:Tfp pilus assembly protein FimV
MTRTDVRRRRRRLGLVLVGLGIVLAMSGPAIRAVAPAPPSLVSRHSYTVRAGDTVWTIAERLEPPDQDPRPLVDEIVRDNGGGTTLTPGEVLSIPTD